MPSCGSGRRHANDAVAAEGGGTSEVGQHVVRYVKIAGNLLRHEIVLSHDCETNIKYTRFSAGAVIL